MTTNHLDKCEQKSLEAAADAYYLPDCRPFGWQDNPVVRRIALALDAARQERREWQDISTAPKGGGDEGPRILLLGPKDNGETYVESGRWYRTHWPIVWMHGHGEPTHWQPLPAPPSRPQP